MPDQRTYDLADLTVRYLKRELRLEEDGGAGSEPATLFDDPAHDPTHASAMIRARAVIDLAEAMQTELADRSQEHLLTDIELPLQQTLARMERLGVAIDTDHLEQLESHFDARVTEAADAAYAVLGKEINLGSPKQLQVVLFDELGLKKTRRTKSGYTTDAAALQQLYADTEHPFLAHLLAHRDNIKLRQTIEGAAQGGRRRRPGAHHLPADDRGDRSAVQHRPEPAEHPDPDRGGPPDPGGVRARAAVRVADVGRLLPDRDAADGAHVRG